MTAKTFQRCVLAASSKLNVHRLMVQDYCVVKSNELPRLAQLRSQYPPKTAGNSISAPCHHLGSGEIGDGIQEDLSEKPPVRRRERVCPTSWPPQKDFSFYLASHETVKADTTYSICTTLHSSYSSRYDPIGKLRRPPNSFCEVFNELTRPHFGSHIKWRWSISGTPITPGPIRRKYVTMTYEQVFKKETRRPTPSKISLPDPNPTHSPLPDRKVGLTKLQFKSDLVTKPLLSSTRVSASAAETKAFPGMLDHRGLAGLD
ncbi:hypothetical protein CUMW_191700 [Citrus unshiu]|uniref:Uncharacterized protein n=1 Tax=Citrus unshiu TaxID=55188 RepID=A0A2H5Q341_CITUN|nr:hypothetical protein CUMW_191700 [Citrus unshiu]